MTKPDILGIDMLGKIDALLEEVEESAVIGVASDVQPAEVDLSSQEQETNGWAKLIGRPAIIGFNTQSR
jgi:hypothetical protein